MRNLLTALFALWSVTTMAGLPPTTLGGQAGSASTTFNFKAPNYQATPISGGGRIETGSKNLLQNPSFEHTTIATGWTNTGGGTPASSTTNLQDGAKSITTTSTGAWTFYQDSTLYATAKSGQEAEASIWVYSATASADLWLCPRVNGNSVTASVANGCVQYTNLGAPQKLTVFMLYGSTSTGIEVKGSGAITYILDDAYLGDRRPMAAGETTSPWVSCSFSSMAWQGLGTVTNTSLKCRRDGPDLEMRGKFTTGTVAAAIAQMPLPNNWGTITISSTVGTNEAKGVLFRENATTNTLHTLIINPSTTYVQFGGPLVSTTAVPQTALNGNALFGSSEGEQVTYLKIPIAEWSAADNAFTTKCDDPRQCETVFSALFSSSAGTITSQSITGWVTNSSYAGGEWTVTFGSGFFTVAPSCTATTSSNGGDKGIRVYSESASSIKVVTYSAGATAQDAFHLECQKQGADYTASKLTQQIVQMRGVPVVPSASGAIETFSFSYGTTNATTVCSASPCSYLDQIGSAVTSVTRAGAGSYVLNTTKTYTKLKCSYAVGNSGANLFLFNSSLSCSSCSTLSFLTNNSGGTATDSYGTLYCQGSY